MGLFFCLTAHCGVVFSCGVDPTCVLRISVQTINVGLLVHLFFNPTTICPKFWTHRMDIPVKSRKFYGSVLELSPFSHSPLRGAAIIGIPG